MSLKMEHDLKNLKEKRQRVQEVIDENDPLTYQTALQLVTLFDPLIERMEVAVERKKQNGIEIVLE